MLKFATRRVCGYLHGPCGVVITAGAAHRHSNPQVAVERSKSAQIQKFASRLLSSRCGFSAFCWPFWPRFRAPGALGSAGGFFAPNHPNLRPPICPCFSPSAVPAGCKKKPVTNFPVPEAEFSGRGRAFSTSLRPERPLMEQEAKGQGAVGCGLRAAPYGNTVECKVGDSSMCTGCR